MINEIIREMCNRINEIFSGRYEIHMEHQKQGITEPCFFVSCISHSYEPKIKGRYVYSHTFCVQFFQSDNESREEIYNIIDELYPALEYLLVGNTEVNGTNMNGKVIDGVLHIYVDYNIYVDVNRETSMTRIFSL